MHLSPGDKKKWQGAVDETKKSERKPLGRLIRERQFPDAADGEHESRSNAHSYKHDIKRREIAQSNLDEHKRTAPDNREERQ